MDEIINKVEHAIHPIKGAIIAKLIRIIKLRTLIALEALIMDVYQLEGDTTSNKPGSPSESKSHW